DWRFDHPVTGPSIPTLAAIEAAFVRALEDTARSFGASVGWGNDEVSDPRICDAAGHFLAERWPNLYAFDLSAPLKTRDRQRIQCLNVWRQAHGMAPVPLPPSQTVRVARADAAKVTIVEWSRDT